ncbi:MULTISPECIES: hypothetical protein [Calditerrivibrio]|uniref:hypothetical protein n=1 Tax=Calditerrivibrio TaxID=545865 RepID=UPI003C753CB1
MKRREFIKLGITAPLVLSTPSLLEGGAKSDVYIAESANHRKAVVAAIEMMGGDR